MIQIDKIDNTSYNKLKVCSRIIKHETDNSRYNRVIVFTDNVEIIKSNLANIFNLDGVGIKYFVLPFSHSLRDEISSMQKTIILGIMECFQIYKLNFANKISFINYHQLDNFIEVKTKVFEPIIEGNIS